MATWTLITSAGTNSGTKTNGHPQADFYDGNFTFVGTLSTNKVYAMCSLMPPSPDNTGAQWTKGLPSVVAAGFTPSSHPVPVCENLEDTTFYYPVTIPNPPINSGSGGSIEEQTVNLTTNSIATATNTTGTVILTKDFIIKTLSANRDCRIRFYKTAAARTADLLRPFGDSSYLGTQHKMILDILLDDETGLDWELSPGAIGNNGDEPQTNTIYYNIENLSGVTGTVILDIKFLVLIT